MDNDTVSISSSTTSASASASNGFTTKHEANKMKTAGFWQAYMLGIGIALGGFSSTWTIGMECGVWEGFSSLMVLFVGFLMLNLCLSEMCSAVAFAGGSYGYVRCSLGPFYGFIAAAMEVVQYMMYTIYAVQKIAMIITKTGVSESLEPIWALLAYVTITALHCKGGGYFWNVMIALTLFTVSIMLVYFFGSLSVVNFDAYSNNGKDHENMFDDLKCYSKHFEYYFLCYMGVCALPLTSSRIKDEVVVVPKAIMSAICTLFAFAIMIYFTSASQPPNMLTAAHELFTYSYGYYNFAHVPLKYGGLFAILPLYGSAFGFMFASKHQLNAMACSGMLPALLAKRLGENRIPLYALLTTATAQYVVYLLGRLDKGFEFFPICGLFACMMYTGIFSSFIVFRTRFGNMHRHFINPLGIFGAVLGMLIFGYAVLTVVLLHDNYVWITFLVYVAIMIVYYYLHVESNQFFSKEEQDKFMKAYILNMNTRKKSNSGQSNVCSMMFTRMIRQIKSALTGKSFSGRDNEMSKVAPLKSSSNSTTHFSQNSQSSYSKQPKVANSVSTDSYSLNNSMHPLESVKDEESQIVPAEEEVGVGHANGGGADMSSKSHKLQHSQSQVSTTSSSKALVWSGNVMEESDSRKVFQALVVHGEELEESSPQMVSDLFPNYLQVGDEGEVFAQSPSVKVFGGEEVTISTDVSHLKESQIQQATNVIDAY